MDILLTAKQKGVELAKLQDIASIDSIIYLMKNEPFRDLLLGLLPKSEHKSALLVEDSKGDTVFRAAVRSGGVGVTRYLLELLPEKEQRSVLSQEASKGDMVFRAAVRSGGVGVTRYLLELLPEKERRSVVLQENSKGDTILDDALRMNSIGLLGYLLNFLQKAERNLIFSNGELSVHVALRAAFRNGELCSEDAVNLMELLPESERKFVLLKRSKDFPLLHEFVRERDVELALCLIQVIPPTERWSLLSAKNMSGDTVFHLALRMPDANFVLRRLMNLLPSTERKSALLEKNGRGETIIGITSREGGFGAMRDLLSLLPSSERISVILAKDKSGASAFDSFPDSVSVFLLVPETERRSAVLQIVRSMNFRCLVQAGMISPLRDWLDLLPEHERRVAVFSEGSTYPILHDAVRSGCVDLMRYLLEILPEPERRPAVLMQGSSGDDTFLSVLGAAVHGGNDAMRDYLSTL